MRPQRLRPGMTAPLATPLLQACNLKLKMFICLRFCKVMNENVVILLCCVFVQRAARGEAQY